MAGVSHLPLGGGGGQFNGKKDKGRSNGFIHAASPQHDDAVCTFAALRVAHMYVNWLFWKREKVFCVEYGIFRQNIIGRTMVWRVFIRTEC